MYNFNIVVLPRGMTLWRFGYVLTLGRRLLDGEAKVHIDFRLTDLHSPTILFRVDMTFTKSLCVLVFLNAIQMSENSFLLIFQVMFMQKFLLNRKQQQIRLRNI